MCGNAQLTALKHSCILTRSRLVGGKWNYHQAKWLSLLQHCKYIHIALSHTLTCMHVQMHTHMHACTNTHVQIHTHDPCMHVQIHTRMHTYSFNFIPPSTTILPCAITILLVSGGWKGKACAGVTLAHLCERTFMFIHAHLSFHRSKSVALNALPPASKRVGTHRIP